MNKNSPVVRFLISSIRYVIGFLILGALVYSVDVRQLLEVFKSIGPLWFMGALLSIFVVRFFMGVRWFVVLKSTASVFSMWKIVFINYVSGSIGMITPGGVGGDILRGYLINTSGLKVVSIARTILVDRLMGIYSLACLCLMGLIFLRGMDDVPTLPSWFLPFVLAMVVLTPLFFVVGVRFRINFSKISGRLGKIDKIVQGFDTHSESPTTLVAIFLISMMVQFIRCIVIYLLFRAFGVVLDFYYFLVFSPLIFLASMLPISPAGLGVREGMTVFLFGFLGVDVADCIAVGLSFQVAQVIVALPGVFSWFLGGVKRTN